MLPVLDGTQTPKAALGPFVRDGQWPPLQLDTHLAAQVERTSWGADGSITC